MPIRDRIEQADVPLDPKIVDSSKAAIEYGLQQALTGNAVVIGCFMEAARKLTAPPVNRTSAEEYNERLREFLKSNHEPTVADAMNAIDCTSCKTFYKLPAWIAVQGELAKGRKPKAVSLTPDMEAVIPDRDEALARLTAEQRRDMTQHRVGRTERV